MLGYAQKKSRMVKLTSSREIFLWQCDYWEFLFVVFFKKFSAGAGGGAYLGSSVGYPSVRLQLRS